MVYSLVCNWLEDYLSDNEPAELFDTWDFIEWLDESEIVSLFNDCFVKTLKKVQSRKDAINILYSLLWEYYLLIRDKNLAHFKPDEKIYLRLKDLDNTPQQTKEWFREKRDILTASEFSQAVGNTKARADLIRSKVEHRLYDIHSDDVQRTVFLSRDGRLNALAWGQKYEPVIKQIYSKYIAKGEVYDCGRYRHPLLPNLAASPDGVIINGPRAGRLLEIKSPLSREIEDDMIPEEYYCQTQVQMQVCDAEYLDFCECRLVAGEKWKLKGNGFCVGAVAVVGDRQDYRTWRYVYSPLFENTAEGRSECETWRPSDEEVLEINLWEIEKIQVVTLRRNPRWWAIVGQPAYESFWKAVYDARKDPLYLAPEFQDYEVVIGEGDGPVPSKPMFLDD